MGEAILGIWSPVNVTYADAQKFVQSQKFKIQCMALGIDEKNAQDLVDFVSERSASTPYTFFELASSIKLSLALGLSLVKALEKFNEDFLA